MRTSSPWCCDDKGLLLFFGFLPFVYPVLYSLIYNPEVVREVEMIVVDHDRTPLSREMVRKIDACEQDGSWATPPTWPKPARP